MEKPGGHFDGGSRGPTISLIKVNFCTQTGRVGTRKRMLVSANDIKATTHTPDQNRDDIAMEGNPQDREGRRPTVEEDRAPTRSHWAARSKAHQRLPSRQLQQQVFPKSACCS